MYDRATGRFTRYRPFPFTECKSAYRCGLCGFETDDQAEFREHQRKGHLPRA